MCHPDGHSNAMQRGGENAEDAKVKVCMERGEEEGGKSAIAVRG
jgi:hypothetical protein